MAQARFAIGVDFGTESGRAVLVDVADGRELRGGGLSLRERRHRRETPGARRRRRAGPRLGPAGSERLHRDVQADCSRGRRQGRIDPSQVIGIGIDFTACTMLPTTADGTPLCETLEWRRNPHSWVKLWKHHAAQPEADDVTALPPIWARTGCAVTAAGSRRSGSFPRPSRSCAKRRRYTTPPIDSSRPPTGRVAAHRQGDEEQLHGRLQGHLVR